MKFHCGVCKHIIIRIKGIQMNVLEHTGVLRNVQYTRKDVLMKLR